MTDKDNEKKENTKQDQLMLTTQDEEKTTENVNQRIESTKSTKSTNSIGNAELDNETSEEKEKFSFSALKYSQTPKEKELFKRLSFILSVLAIGIFITLYFISPFSKVDQIILSGVKKSNAEKVVNSSKIKPDKSLWEQFFKKDEYSAAIVKENPRVETAKISLEGLNNLKIAVKEYETIGYVQNGSDNFEVLSNGKILKEPIKTLEKELPLLVNFKEGENLSEFLEAYNKFDDKTKKNIENIESLATKTNPFRIKFKMRDGNEVIGLSTTIADKMAFYDKIASEMKEKGVIDMEAGTSGVFSYPFEKTESTETIESSGFEQAEQGQ
ncbi:cell division protein FtsQ/DivIB [Vagococcus carniphilus]|uniref:cell division protein FtsQ/DivIB n=1 Tax=Vagococcus carniphilus TaxID=218144 RepID=UPI002890C814|nr:cell division protein FtsQ/DivIB [Vagococcus carniphilus]MDT2850021.1 cell division protein FtsQ/DivIB [Vagococcus carniphilus]